MVEECPFFIHLVGGRLNGLYVNLGRSQTTGRCRVSVQFHKVLACWIDPDNEYVKPLEEFSIPIGEYEVGKGCKAILIKEVHV